MSLSYPLPNPKLNGLDRCQKILSSEETLLTNTWPAKPAEPLVRTFPTGRPTRPRSAARILAFLHLPFHRTCEPSSALLCSPNTFFQGGSFNFPRVFLVATPSGATIPRARQTITAKAHLPSRYTLVQQYPQEVELQCVQRRFL